jgi:hypothetical protein
MPICASQCIASQTYPHPCTLGCPTNIQSTHLCEQNVDVNLCACLIVARYWCHGMTWGPNIWTTHGGPPPLCCSCNTFSSTH